MVTQEVIGARSKWIQDHPGKQPHVISLSPDADDDLCWLINEENKVRIALGNMDPKETTDKCLLYGMRIVVDPAQTVRVIVRD